VTDLNTAAVVIVIDVSTGEERDAPIAPPPVEPPNEDDDTHEQLGLQHVDD
jgi:hypothetical protein